MIKYGLFTVISLCLLISTGFAQTPGAVGAPASMDEAAKKAMANKIESLLALPAKERRTQLKQMNPKERRGLWFQLKREQQARKGITPRKRGSYAEPISIDGTGAEWVNRDLGTIVYDSGFPTTAFGGGNIIGNHFNTHTGVPVFANGSVTAIQALVVPGGAATVSNSAGFVLEGPQTVGGGALALFSTFTSASGLIDSLSFTGLNVNYTGSSFFVLFGDFDTVFIPVFGPGTNLAQGHHGVNGITGGMGPNISATSPFPGLNAFIRANGDIVPVELMQFEVK